MTHFLKKNNYYKRNLTLQKKTKINLDIYGCRKSCRNEILLPMKYLLENEQMKRKCEVCYQRQANEK